MQENPGNPFKPRLLTCDFQFFKIPQPLTHKDLQIKRQQK